MDTILQRFVVARPSPVTPVVRPAEPLPRATRSEVPLNGIAEVTYARHILTSRGERHPIESRFEIIRIL
jgi:hypothetical protein